MYSTYMLGFYFGLCLTGAIVGGVIPLIISIVKKRIGIGVLAFFSCGLVALIESWVSILVGIGFIIFLLATKKKKSEKEVELENYEEMYERGEISYAEFTSKKLELESNK